LLRVDWLEAQFSQPSFRGRQQAGAQSRYASVSGSGFRARRLRGAPELSQFKRDIRAFDSARWRTARRGIKIPTKELSEADFVETN
jgi:hypothetical protein